MKIKLCGIRRMEDVKALNTMISNSLGPDIAGFVFAPGKRQITLSQAAVLRAALSPAITAAGVFVNAPLDTVIEAASNGTIQMIQLHGDEDETYMASLKKLLVSASPRPVPIIKAVRVKTRQDMTDADSSTADFLLLDTYVKDQYGGSGLSFDWTMIQPLKKPYFLAGGIGSGNIRQAMATGAWGLDVSSSVETDGWKDPEKIKEIISIVKE